MPEQLKNSESETIDLLHLRYETRRALGQYTLTLQQARKAQELLELADTVMELVNAGLPEGYKVGTNSSFKPEEDMFGAGGYNKIYRTDESGQYVLAGELCTEGSKRPFLGDRIQKIGEDLVIINEELQIGFSIKDEVFIVDTNNDPLERTIGGSVDERFKETLLPLIDAVPIGGTEAFDCLYY